MEETGEAGGGESIAEKISPTVKETEASQQQDGLLRENMVDLATRFLTNSRVQSSPMEYRRAFLKKKGGVLEHFDYGASYVDSVFNDRGIPFIM